MGKSTARDFTLLYIEKEDCGGGPVITKAKVEIMTIILMMMVMAMMMLLLLLMMFLMMMMMNHHR